MVIKTLTCCCLNWLLHPNLFTIKKADCLLFVMHSAMNSLGQLMLLTITAQDVKNVNTDHFIGCGIELKTEEALNFDCCNLHNFGLS